MAYKNTIAIIGASTTVGTFIAKSVAANYHLLLMDAEQPQLIHLQAEIQAMGKTAKVDVLHCCKDATWEADIIVVVYDGDDLEKNAVKMKEVSNCKPVLHFTSFHNDKDNLQQLLPHAKVVTIIASQPFTGANADAFIHGTDKEAINTAKLIVAAMACKPQIT